MSSNNQQHILTIGAGITGLTIAHGLQNRNVPFSIFEAEPEGTFRPREWTMGIHWSLKNLEALLPEHLRARLISDASVDPSLDPSVYPTNSMSIYEGVGGKLMKEIGVRDDDGGEGKLMRVSRRKLRALCAEGIDVKYGCKLNSIAEDDDATITVSFENGTEARGTLLIGTDSSHSAVRTHLLGEEKAATTPMDLTHVNNTVCYHDAAKALFVRKAHPVFSVMQASNVFAFISMQDVPDPTKPEDWKFQIVTRLAWHAG